MGLAGAFQVRVSADDGMDTRAQCLLSAALQLNRPPNRCVVFDASPAGITAAHNCTMKVRTTPGSHAWSHALVQPLSCGDSASGLCIQTVL